MSNQVARKATASSSSDADVRRRMRLQRALSLLAGLAILAATAQYFFYRTSPKPRARRVAFGAIRNADGSPMAGVKGQVYFCPVLPDRPHDIGPYERGELKATRLTGSIRSDGAFELWTTSAADGAVPSHYKVFFLEAENERPGPPIVPTAYHSYELSDWVVALRPDRQEEISLTLSALPLEPHAPHAHATHEHAGQSHTAHPQEAHPQEAHVDATDASETAPHSAESESTEREAAPDRSDAESSR